MERLETNEQSLKVLTNNVNEHVSEFNSVVNDMNNDIHTKYNEFKEEIKTFIETLNDYALKADLDNVDNKFSNYTTSTDLSNSYYTKTDADNKFSLKNEKSSSLSLLTTKRYKQEEVRIVKLPLRNLFILIKINYFISYLDNNISEGIDCVPNDLKIMTNFKNYTL